MSKITTYAQSFEKHRERDCPICLEEFTRNTIVHELGCKHIFHPECVQQLPTRFCPLCRVPIQELTHNENDKGFYKFLLHYLAVQWPNEKGGWDEGDFHTFALELAHELREHQEWTHFVPLKSFFDLVRIFDSEYPDDSEVNDESLWQESLFQEFMKHSAIRPLFIMLAQRYVHFCASRDRMMNIFNRTKNFLLPQKEAQQALIEAHNLVSSADDEFPWRRRNSPLQINPIEE
ncbi:MAG: RING finger domain-containing protein [Parachlamydiaceae bacterium]